MESMQKEKCPSRSVISRATKYLVMLFVLCLLTNVEVYAQSGNITGTIVDVQGEPLIGATVVVPGTTAQALSDLDGKYSIAATKGDVIEFTYIGMVAQKVTVGNTVVIDVILNDDTKLLDEIVVIGYGTAKKVDLTGSIASIGGKDIVKQAALNPVQAVQGKLAGVNVIGSDAPGAAPSVTIRGMGTALGGREPLYIVDGFPVTDIKNINSSDIVSMDILKDASSASIYGVRAANGVVLITTKRGEAGTAKISVESYIGIKNTLNKVKMANANEYIQFYNENMATMRASAGTPAEAAKYIDLASSQPYDTDWYDELTKTGIVNNNAISISGGSKTVDYYVSYNYYKEKGIVEGQDYNRSTIRNNNVYRFFNDRLTISQNLNVSFSKSHHKPYGAFTDAYRQTPLAPVYYDDLIDGVKKYGKGIYNPATGIVGKIPAAGDQTNTLNSIGNPIQNAELANQRSDDLTLQGGLEAQFKITDYLKINSRFGATKYSSRFREFNDVRTAWLNGAVGRTNTGFEAERVKAPTSESYANNSLFIKNFESFRWTWEAFATFNKKIDLHSFEAVVGTSAEKYGIDNYSSSKGFNVPTKSQYWSIDHATKAYPREAKGLYYTPTSLMAYFGRIQYNYDSKYYLTATLRRDGSSTFKDMGDQWGTFPSVGLGWTISRESFLSDVTVLDHLKLKATWGKLGNQNVPLNVWQIRTGDAGTNYNPVFGDGQELVTGAAMGTPVVPLSWEVTREWGIGADFSLLDQRLNGSIEYYNKMNSNAILSVKPKANSGFSDEYRAHAAKIENAGFEFAASWSDRFENSLTYEVGFNYTYNKNQVKSVRPGFDRATGGSLSDGQITKQLREGQPVYAWWMLESDGVWQSKAEIDAAIANGDAVLSTAKPGHLKYKDQDDNGILDDRDKVYAGSYMPTSNYGIFVNLGYKNADFSIAGYGVAGNKIYNGLKHGRIDGGENITKDTFNSRWHGEGTSNTNPGANRDSRSSTHFLEKGDYFRINNITVGYTFKDLVFKGSNLRAYFAAQNPFIFTNYSGFSPELPGMLDGQESVNLREQVGDPTRTAGIELSAYPSQRSFLFGLNLSF